MTTGRVGRLDDDQDWHAGATDFEGPSGDWNNFQAPDVQEKKKRRRRGNKKVKRIPKKRVKRGKKGNNPKFNLKNFIKKKKSSVSKRVSNEGIFLDKRTTLHSLMGKMSWAKVPLVKLVK